MGYEYYLFASYVFVLICAILFICKFLFSGNTKRDKQMLDDMESKLLRTYQTLEDAMDEFYDLIDESREDLEKKYKEIDHLISTVSSQPSEAAEAPPSPAPKPRTRRSQPRSAPKKEEDDQLGFEHLFNEITAKTGAPISSLHEHVLELSKEGKERAEIAKELKITQNEVELVLGMNKAP